MSNVDAWDAELKRGRELTPEFCHEFAASMRARKLTFGDRIHSPFLRPFFLSAADESRIRRASETIAAVGERVVREALESRALFDQLGVTEPEERLIRIDPGYHTASTASRLDAFLLPDGLHFAEYNAESPAGPAYTQRLCELYDLLPAMGRFRETHAVRFHKTIPPLLDALLESYREWGGAAQPPTVAIVDWRSVPTWTEFELLRDAFIVGGVPTVVCDPRELEYDGKTLSAEGRKVDLVYRRVLINDIVSEPDACANLVRAYQDRTVCVANTFRCKLPHKKAFFAVLTDPRNAALFSEPERTVIAAHVPWTRLVADTRTERHGEQDGLLELARRDRESLVLKPNDEYGGKGIVLGWEVDQGAWDAALKTALAEPYIVQRRIELPTEPYPSLVDGRLLVLDRMVDTAPYVAYGEYVDGCLSRLSTAALHNVRGGGGSQPPTRGAERG